MVFPILGGNSAVGGYAIDNSLRFNDDDNAYLSKTLSASPTNQKIVSFSFWAKRGNLGVYSYNLVGNTSAPYVVIGFLNDDTFSFQLNAGSGSTGLITTAKYRDTSAWYHMLCVLDTTQATSSNRLKIYINGIQITDFGTANYPTQDTTWNINTNVEHGIGGSSAIQDFDGYMAEVHFIDGQALSPTDFGEFDEDSGIWKPIRYSGSYGTNGFYLDFENSGSLGADQSGNGNDFTPTNLTSTDQTTDTPTNNFNTLNPLSYLTAGGGVAWSEGNCRVEMTSNDTDLMCNGTFAVSSGKWYFEWKVTDLNVLAGIHDADAPLTSNNYNNSSLVYIRGGSALQAPVDVTGLTSIATNDILSMFVDLDNFTVKTAVNGVDDGYTKSIEQKTYTFGNCTNGSSSSSAGAQFNFGNPSFTISSGNSDANGYGNFEYSPNDGTYDYLALCTQNLATVSPPTIDDGSQYFNTVLWTGNATDDRSITGVGFAPDFVWTKERSSTSSHVVHDTIRGATYTLIPNQNASESVQADILQAFESDGFEIGTSGVINESGQTYVGWNWKANGGATSTNTDGSQNSTVQVNSTAGFSIVKRTGTGSAGATYGHGLGVEPEVIINKGLTTNEWYSYFKAIGGGTHWIDLSGTGAKVDDANMWNDIDATSTVFTVGNSGGSNGSGVEYIAYCFHSVEGYSKFGSYTGNGSTDGTFVYTGFRPAWVLYKKSSATENWHILDNKRDTLNPNSFGIDPNTTGAEANDANLQMDFLSNGFKLRTSHGTANASGSTYIYMAFAESPFVTSTSIPVTAR
jgi:hypothetical protein